MKQKVIIIAEAGVNHNGSIELAKKLIDVAASAGVDFVKFQTFKADKLVTKKTKKAEYQILNTDNQDDSQYNMLKKLELSDLMHKELFAYATQKGIQFLSSGFDEDSIDYLDQLGMPLFKIPSGEITNKPYLQHIARKGKPVIISTGMANLHEVKDAVDVLTKYGLNLDQITVLHCTTEYPAPINEVNLLAMTTMAETFKVKVGYSDHTEGIEISLAAVAMGATVIEKHFTLDKNMEGPDHKASLEPDELKKMITGIRNIEMALGDGIKIPSPSEIKNKVAARKSIVAFKLIKSGELFSSGNLTVKRPGNGLSPMLWDKVIGMVSKKNYNPDELIEL
jgi:N,N'-diacetyllegionaminate synthase